MKFNQGLQALQQDIRMVVYYADVEGFSYAEIAHITNRSVRVVMSLLRRGRHQLRNLLLAAIREPATGQFWNGALKNPVLEQRATARHAPASWRWTPRRETRSASATAPTATTSATWATIAPWSMEITPRQRCGIR